MKHIFSAALTTMLLWMCFFIPVKAEVLEEKAEVVYTPEVEWQSFQDQDNYVLQRNGDDCEILIPKTNETAAVRQGDSIVLPANEENPGGAAVIVKEITEDTDTFHWICAEPDVLSDFIESMDISGYGELLTEQAEGTPPFEKARGIDVSMGNQISQAGRMEYCFDHTVLKDAAILNGRVSVEITSIEYRLKMDVGMGKTRVEDFYFAVNHTVNVDADITFQTQGLTTGGEIKLGSVPFVFGSTGVNGEITFWLSYDAKGNIHVNYTLSNLAGITWENGAYRPFGENTSAFAAAAGCTFAAGPKMQFILKFGQMKLMDVTLYSGLAGNGSALYSEADPKDSGYLLDAYAYLSLRPGTQGLINHTLGLKDMDIWNENDSPFHMTYKGSF